MASAYSHIAAAVGSVSKVLNLKIADKVAQMDQEEAIDYRARLRASRSNVGRTPKE